MDCNYCCAQHLSTATPTNHHLKKLLPQFSRVVGVILISLCASLPFSATTSLCQANVSFFNPNNPHSSFISSPYNVPLACRSFCFQSIFIFFFVPFFIFLSLGTKPCHFFPLRPRKVVSMKFNMVKKQFSMVKKQFNMVKKQFCTRIECLDF